MRKLTYTNLTNGLTVEFSSESPTMHLNLADFDGCSLGASAISYNPVELDGQKLISTSLNARTIVVPVEISARADGRFSRAGALAAWENLLKVFVPLHEGWLTWTDGTNSRRIKCRTAEVPQLTQTLPFLFSATISLIADFPYWESLTEHSIAVAASAAAVTVNNTCGLAVPLCVDVPAGGSAPLIYNRTTGCGLSFAIAPEQACTVDTRECTVTLADGSYANHLLSVESEFFRLAPGNNELQVLGTGTSNTATKANKSGVCGVNWDKSRGKWQASIKFQGHKYNLGRFDEFDDAVKARREAEEKIFGGFLEWYNARKK